MKKKVVEAHIECNSSGFYSIYIEHGDLPFWFYGDGETIDKAQADFYAVYKDMREDYKKEHGVDVDAEFTFVYDTSALLQEYKDIISVKALADVTGISHVMLSQYARGIRHPRPAQRERIISGIHEVGRRCLAAR